MLLAVAASPSSQDSLTAVRQASVLDIFQRCEDGTIGSPLPVTELASDVQVGMSDLVWGYAGRELQQQVAQLQAEYLRVGDQLEGEQTRIMQVPADSTPAATQGHAQLIQPE